MFHHLARPARFFDEASRVLMPGGRIVILDPYCSPISTLAYRRFHHERTDLSAGAFEDDATIAAEPLASNQARSTLAFFRHEEELSADGPASPSCIDDGSLCSHIRSRAASPERSASRTGSD